MSTKPKYVEPTPEQAARAQEIIETLCRLSRGTSALTHEQARDFLGGLLRYLRGGKVRHASDGNSYFVEAGEPFDVEVPPLSYLPVFEPHLEAALAANNIALAACLTLSAWMMHQYEGHIPRYGEMIRAKQRNARVSAAKRRDEGKNVLAHIEAWERERQYLLTPEATREGIAACATDGGYSKATIRNALKARARHG